MQATPGAIPDSNYHGLGDSHALVGSVKSCVAKIKVVKNREVQISSSCLPKVAEDTLSDKRVCALYDAVNAAFRMFLSDLSAKLCNVHCPYQRALALIKQSSEWKS